MKMTLGITLESAPGVVPPKLDKLDFPALHRTVSTFMSFSTVEIEWWRNFLEVLKNTFSDVSSLTR